MHLCCYILGTQTTKKISSGRLPRSPRTFLLINGLAFQKRRERSFWFGSTRSADLPSSLSRYRYMLVGPAVYASTGGDDSPLSTCSPLPGATSPTRRPPFFRQIIAHFSLTHASRLPPVLRRLRKAVALVLTVLMAKDGGGRVRTGSPRSQGCRLPRRRRSSCTMFPSTTAAGSCRLLHGALLLCRHPRWWLAAGSSIGFGMRSKYTMEFCGLSWSPVFSSPTRGFISAAMAL